jgi:hypothetical protein
LKTILGRDNRLGNRWIGGRSQSDEVLVVLGVTYYDNALREDKAIAPAANASADALRTYNTA